jgi:hypothetical protein
METNITGPLTNVSGFLSPDLNTLELDPFKRSFFTTAGMVWVALKPEREKRSMQ